MTIETTAQEGLRLLGERFDDPRAQVLLEAASCILRNRNSTYGEPEDNFERIARFSNGWLKEKLAPGQEITALDVAMNGLHIKLGRLIQSPDHTDSYVDAIGYLACAFRVMILDKDAPIGVGTTTADWEAYLEKRGPVITTQGQVEVTSTANEMQQAAPEVKTHDAAKTKDWVDLYLKKREEEPKVTLPLMTTKA